MEVSFLLALRAISSVLCIDFFLQIIETFDTDNHIKVSGLVATLGKYQIVRCSQTIEVFYWLT